MEVKMESRVILAAGEGIRGYTHAPQPIAQVDKGVYLLEVSSMEE